ncbi:MAG: hypothetical protein KJ968_01115 [Nanoarchaeota archaeon]|nr:hypothetical protein [Nanoarchaeota archaeon]MBU4283681.1 hypothetical protein [Nanoarchaeota archaeon]
MKKQKILVLTGAISTLLGSIGAVISGLGLCACVWAPLFSLAGLASLTVGFLSNNKIFFLITGIILLLISLILHKTKKAFKIHHKKF